MTGEARCRRRAWSSWRSGLCTLTGTRLVFRAQSLGFADLSRVMERSPTRHRESTTDMVNRALPGGRREPDGNPLGDESGPTGRVFRLPHADGCAPVVARLSDPCRRRPQRTVPRPVDLHVSIRTSRCLPVR